MEGGRAAGEGNAVGPVGNGRQLGLEGVDLGPERGDPTPFEGTVEGGLVGQPGVRWGQIDAAHRMPVRLPGTVMGQQPPSQVQMPLPVSVNWVLPGGVRNSQSRPPG